MERFLIEHGTNVPSPVIQFSLELYKREKENKHYLQGNDPGQADLADLQLFEDNDYKYIFSYQDCFSKFIIP